MYYLMCQLLSINSVYSYLLYWYIFQSHETRSLDKNRGIAREKLKAKIDWHYNRENSLAELKKKEASKRQNEKKKKTIEKLQKLKEFKEREGI